LSNNDNSPRVQHTVSSHRSSTLWADTVQIGRYQFDIFAVPISPTCIDLSFSRNAGLGKMRFRDALVFMKEARRFITDIIRSGQLFEDKESKYLQIKITDPAMLHIGLYSKLVDRWKSKVIKDLNNKFILQNVAETNSSLVIFIQRS